MKAAIYFTGRPWQWYLSLSRHSDIVNEISPLCTFAVGEGGSMCWPAATHCKIMKGEPFCAPLYMEEEEIIFAERLPFKPVWSDRHGVTLTEAGRIFSAKSFMPCPARAAVLRIFAWRPGVQNLLHAPRRDIFCALRALLLRARWSLMLYYVSLARKYRCAFAATSPHPHPLQVQIDSIQSIYHYIFINVYMYISYNISYICIYMYI